MGNNYLTYAEYVALGGTIPEVPFNILEFNAEKLIDNKTYGRLMNLTEQVEEVKMCMYSLIGILSEYSFETDKNKNIASENTDGYSVSYVTPSTEFIKSKKFDLDDCIDYYLSECRLNDGTPYLYI